MQMKNKRRLEMKVDIKSFLIGILTTVNLFLLYGFTYSANCDTYYDSDDIMRKVKDVESKVEDIESKVSSVYSEVSSIYTEVMYD